MGDNIEILKSSSYQSLHNGTLTAAKRFVRFARKAEELFNKSG